MIFALASHNSSTVHPHFQKFFLLVLLVYFDTDCFYPLCICIEQTKQARNLGSNPGGGRGPPSSGAAAVDQFSQIFGLSFSKNSCASFTQEIMTQIVVSSLYMYRTDIQIIFLLV